jgi:hypothetical protein
MALQYFQISFGEEWKDDGGNAKRMRTWLSRMEDVDQTQVLSGSGCPFCNRAAHLGSNKFQSIETFPCAIPASQISFTVVKNLV